MSKKDPMQFAGGDCEPPKTPPTAGDFIERLIRMESRLELIDEALRVLLGAGEKFQKYQPLIDALLRKYVTVDKKTGEPKLNIWG